MSSNHRVPTIAPLATPSIWGNVLISSVVFFGGLGLALWSDGFDRPLTWLINSFVGRSAVFDRLAVAAFRDATFSGVILMALIWSCWFDSRDPEKRARILIGTLASLGTGVISRFLQHALSIHQRPFYEPGFQQPSGFRASLNTWNSFPSDHVAVFGGLVIVIFLARSRFALFAIVLTVFMELSRTYVGGHYPSDLIGAAGLAGMVVWASQTSRIVSLGRWIADWEQTSPSIFYMIAFFLSYQIATLFSDLRESLSLIWHDL
jgi:membrane-associated phospholipid phosphatase